MELILYLLVAIVVFCLAIFLVVTGINLIYWWIKVLRCKLNEKFDIGRWDLL